MTNEEIEKIKFSLKCCADEVDGCPKCPYARKNSDNGISHCRQASLDALQLLDEYEKEVQKQKDLYVECYRKMCDLQEQASIQKGEIERLKSTLAHYGVKFV